MALVKIEQTEYSVRAKTEDGVDVKLRRVANSKNTYYNIKEMNGRIGIMSLFEKLSKVCRSGRDNEIIGDVIGSADNTNHIHIHNQVEYVKQLGCSRDTFVKLMNRAHEHNLLHKIETGHYLLNPYVIMSKGLTAAGYEAQEDAQIEWSKTTGLITDKQLKGIADLSKYLGLDQPLRITDFTVSVGEYYSRNGKITDKQRVTLTNNKEVGND